MTLTAWRLLSSCSRSLMEGSCVTWAPSTPSGGLCRGKRQSKSCVRPKQAAFSLSCQPGEHLQAAPKQPGTARQSSGEQRQW